MPKIIVTTSKGLDDLLKQEAEKLLDSEKRGMHLQLQPGQISFEGELEDAYTLCLHSRLANRVLWVLTEGRVNSAEDLYEVAKQIDWPMQFSSHVPFVVHFNGTNNAINNSQFGALKTKDAIVDSFVEDEQERPNVDKTNPGIIFQCRLRREQLSISVDLSGGSLHRRGYRTDAGEAPLKEHVAAGILMRSAWSQDMQKPLLDPMCGSGTIAIEAAMMAANIPPSMQRADWGFDHWLGHQASIWDTTLASAKAQITEPSAHIYAYDLSTKMLELAQQNAQRADVAAYIRFKQCDVLEALVNEEQPGYIVSNPPYGERLGEYTSLLPLFDKLGDHLKQAFAGWHVSLLSSNADLLKALKLRYQRSYKIMNGALDCVLANYHIAGANLEVFESNTDDNHEFANRLRKNLKKLKPWLKKANTNAYRVYDADLPHYNIAVDVYGDWAVVQEYAAPKDIPESKTKQRLQEALIHIPKVLDIPSSKVSVKVRQQTKGKTQYQRLDKKGTRTIVHEHGAQFYVNPTDYLDVGLFLDHRQTRLMFKQMCAGKDVLNLFAYTGSVSVHAGQAGARSVTSVDMSNTYIDWAKDNVALNKINAAFEFVQADCLKWLAGHASQYDLIFLDPPSFSNSKRMDDTWDVQRDHLALISDAKKCLRKGGKLFFSNNLRQFTLDQAGIEALGFKVENITKQTIPEDFKRNAKIHHCWILSL